MRATRISIQSKFNSKTFKFIAWSKAAPINIFYILNSYLLTLDIGECSAAFVPEEYKKLTLLSTARACTAVVQDC